MIDKKQNIWPVILVLDDDRPGNYSQAIGLAEALVKIVPYEIQVKKIIYNGLAKLPNFLKIDGLMGIDKASKNTLLSHTNPPKIIISAGRKSAPIAAFLKKYHSSNIKVFAAQIMHPNLCFDKFDAVILPNHDKASQQKNTIRIDGALTKINDDTFKIEYQKFAAELSKVNSPKIALLVGGSSKKGNFDAKIAQNLGEMVSKITSKMQASLLILNSRRTGDVITEILDQNLNCQLPATKTFFKWQNKNWQNPYFAVLAAADFIIATGDSISMCSEICSIGKPIYIFNPPQICSAKHLKFHNNLFAGNFAKRLDGSVEILENYPTIKLDETARIAKLIHEIM